MAGDDSPSKHSKEGGKTHAKYDEDPLADLFQLEKERLPIDEEDIVVINKLFNDVSDFYKLKENIRVVLKENYMNEQEIENFFIRLIRRNSSSKYTLGKKVGYSDHRTLWKFIFDLPEMIRGRAVRIRSYQHIISNMLV
jgi:hypothetical protein